MKNNSKQLSFPVPSSPACVSCRAIIPPMAEGTLVSNYGVDRQGDKHCLSCCAEQMRYVMRNQDKFTLYLTQRHEAVTLASLRQHPPKGGISVPRGDFTISDAFGEIKITPTGVRISRHNIARVCYTAWFTFENRDFIAKRYGDMGEVAHVKLIKGRAR